MFIENLELKTENEFDFSKKYNKNNNKNIINYKRSNSFKKANELKEKFNQEIKNKKNCFHFYSNSFKSIPIKNFSIISMNNNKLIRDSSIELIQKKKNKSNQNLFNFVSNSNNNKNIHKNSQKKITKNINNLYKYIGISKKKPKKNYDKIIDNILIRSTNNKENNNYLNIYKNSFINNKTTNYFGKTLNLINKQNKFNKSNKIPKNSTSFNLNKNNNNNKSNSNLLTYSISNLNTVNNHSRNSLLTESLSLRKSLVKLDNNDEDYFKTSRANQSTYFI